MDLNLRLVKDLSWVLQLTPLKNIIMECLLFLLIGYHWDEIMELHCDHQMELHMDLNLGLMKELC